MSPRNAPASEPDLEPCTMDLCLCWRLPLPGKSNSWWGHCSFLLGCSAHKVLFVLPRVSFSPVLWKFCNQILLTFKVRFCGNSQSLCWIPRLGSLFWGLETSQQWENFFGIIFLQFVDRQPGSSLMGLMATSSKGLCHMLHLPGPLLPVALFLHQAIADHASAGDPQTLTGRSGSDSSRGGGGVTAPFPKS